MRTNIVFGAASVAIGLTLANPAAAQQGGPTMRPVSNTNCQAPDSANPAVLPDGRVDVTVHRNGRFWIDIYRLVGWSGMMPIFDREQRVFHQPCHHNGGPTDPGL